MKRKKDDDLQYWIEESNDKQMIWSVLYNCFIGLLMVIWPAVCIIIMFKWEGIKSYMNEVIRGFIIGLSTLPIMLYTGIKILDYRYKKRKSKRHS